MTPAGKDFIISFLCTLLVDDVAPSQGSHRLEKYLNMQDCLEKSLKIKFALNST